MEPMPFTVTILVKGNCTAFCEQEKQRHVFVWPCHYLFTPWSTGLLEKLTGC
jgi:hypothetical protein